MANSGAKKLIKANRQRLTALCGAIAGTNLIFGVVRGILLRHSFTRFFQVIWGLLGLLYAIPLSLIWVAARPQYAADGSIVHGGDDVSKSGILEYAHDVIYVTIVTQLGLLFSRWALTLLLVIPAYVVYFVLSAGVFAPRAGNNGDDNDERNAGGDRDAQFASMSRKERRKADRKARKQQDK